MDLTEEGRLNTFSVKLSARTLFLDAMWYRIAADLTIVLHFLWIAFVILGFPLFLYLNHAKGRIIHLLVLVVMIAMQWTRTICPLTYLEVYLKSRGSSGAVYPGQFMTETIERLIYVEDLTLEKISYATLLYVAVVALSFWFRPIRRQR